MVQIPVKFPGLKWATGLLGVYTAVWISLEGALWRVVVMGVSVTVVGLGYLGQRYGAGRRLEWWQWLLVTAVGGVVAGVGSGGMTLVFMALKTGLHAHGPEFSVQEILWVGQRLRLWAAAGLLLGVSGGLITLGRWR